MNAPTQIIPPYRHTPLFPLGKDTTTYRKISSEGVRVETVMGREVLVVSREALRLLSEAAFMDINHLLRPGHLASLKSIVEEPETVLGRLGLSPTARAEELAVGDFVRLAESI